MRTFGILTLAAGLLTAAAACSAADPKGESLDSPTPASTNKKHEATPATPPDPTPTPVPERDAGAPNLSKNGIKDGDETDVDCGGTKAAKCDENKSCGSGNDCVSNECSGGRCKPPAVPTHYCQQLPTCCSKLASTLEQIACAGIQLAGKEGACQAELLLCGIGGIGGTPCGNLTACCNQMQQEGYAQDALDCRGHNTGNASVCTNWYSQYQGAGWCN